jgi:hypothetical protein
MHEIRRMTQPAAIVAQIAPQRSTQYSNLARDLAAAELIASPLGAHATEVSMRRIAGEPYLAFKLDRSRLSPTALEQLGCLAMIGNLFELFESIGELDGPFLRPLAAAYPFAFPLDLASTRRYRGKTSEFFTHFMCNIGKFASEFRDDPWQSLIVLDPLSGGGTTLLSGLSLGASVYGIEIVKTSVETTAAFIMQYCREHRIALSSKEERLRKIGARRWAFSIAGANRQQCVLVHGDAAQAKELLAGFRRVQLIITDLPYGIQHNAPLEALVAKCLPGWVELLEPGGSLTFSWDATRFPRGEMARLVERAAPLQVVEGWPYDRLSHRVDRVIKRRDVIVAKPA